MADLIDVSLALCEFIERQIYPNGVNGPGGPSITVSIYPGWPVPGQLQKDLAEVDGKGVQARHVSVFPTNGERNTTRYDTRATEVDRPEKTYGFVVAGQGVTITGGAPTPYHAQNLAIFVNQRAYIHQATAGQTPAQVAAALHALIAVGVPGSIVVGPTITVPGDARIGATRVGIFGRTLEEVRRQEKVWQISIWAESDTGRAEVARMFDAELTKAGWLTLADGSRARVIYRGSNNVDKAQRQIAYVRHLMYSVEYATTIAAKAPEIVVMKTDYETAAGDPIVSVEE